MRYIIYQHNLIAVYFKFLNMQMLILGLEILDSIRSQIRKIKFIKQVHQNVWGCIRNTSNRKDT